MKISKIKKINNSKYQIILENGDKITTYDEVIIKNNILYKKELTDVEIKDISKKNDYYSCYNAAIKYLTKGVHSEKEFNKFLEKYEMTLNEKNKLVEEIKKIGLLNDLKFASAFTYDKFNLNNYGPLKIKKELLLHDIDESIIDLELDKISEVEIKNKVEKLINKKLKTLKGSNYNIRQKLYLYINSMGYDKEYVDLYALNEMDDSKQLENDYNKLYIKLSKKLKDEELYFKIRQKLYQKGYSLSKIDEIIEKKRN